MSTATTVATTSLPLWAPRSARACEEFLVLLPGTDREAAMVAAERLRRAIAAVQIQGDNCAVTASLGVAVMPDDSAESTGLLRGADRALYAAKRAGRNRIEGAETRT